MTTNVDRMDCGSWVLMNEQEQGFYKMLRREGSGHGMCSAVGHGENMRTSEHKP